MIPVAFENAPSVKKPKRSASPTDWELYNKELKTKNLSTYGCTMINSLACNLQESNTKRPLWVSVDGSYTNKNVIRGLSEKITLIGRIRADAKLYYRPEINRSLGRRRVYGSQAPTPEQLRQDPDSPYEVIESFAAGKVHEFKIKSMDNLLWKTAGKNHLFKLIVIAPLGYRLTKGGKMLYREPAYIICTNTSLSTQEILQAYLWRWDIEVNFRDEKTLLGVGQAQVRNEKSVTLVPQMMVASYALLLTAGELIGKTNQPVWRPKWNKYDSQKRLTANDLLQLLRRCLWGKALDQTHFDDFVDVNCHDTNPLNYKIPLNSAVLAATW
ncbi:MAG: hypothetical protein K1X91_17405 [Bacteriodetes bacterium]|nr:hypothetical protein [Bacteroidota bacterium]